MAFQIFLSNPDNLSPLSRVGYHEVHRLIQKGILFPRTLIVSGCGIIAYAVGSMIQFMVERQLRRLPGRKTLEKRLSKPSNHYSFCALGRIDGLVCRGFFTHRRPFWVADKDRQAASIRGRGKISRWEPFHAH